MTRVSQDGIYQAIDFGLKGHSQSYFPSPYLNLVSLMCQLAQPLKCRHKYTMIEGLAVARHHQGTAPGYFDHAESISELKVTSRLIFTTPLCRPQTPYGLSHSKYMKAGSDWTFVVLRTEPSVG